jgi:hypothetical protein
MADECISASRVRYLSDNDWLEVSVGAAAIGRV